MATRNPRVAVGGFMLESNSHAPVAVRAEFAQHCDLAGAALLGDWRSTAPRVAGTVLGFVRAMDELGAWTPLPLRCAQGGASGPVDQAYFDELVASICDGLRAAAPVDAVFLTLHGAAIATADEDPDGTLLARVRAVVGPDVPVLATLDLHGNIVPRMVEAADVLIAYRTNPHVDMHARGADCARVLHEMLAGMRPAAAIVKLPFVPPSVTQNTASGPYRDLIAFGQTQRDRDVVDVSILSGFTLGDTVKNGMSVIVTTRGDAAKARQIATRIARHAWDGRHAWVPRLASLADATARARACGDDPARPSLLFADVADNPGGGARGNTVWILEAFVRAGVRGAVLGPFFDPALAAQAHAAGEGATIDAHFNRDETHPLSGRLVWPARVLRLHAGAYVGRRGISAGNAIDNGPTALVEVDGVQVVVVSRRDQARDPVQFEMLGVDLARVRSLVVKSRGHFRAAFDEFFADERIVEVDVPGLTTPVLANVDWQRMPRPVFPLDPDLHWQPPG